MKYKKISLYIPCFNAERYIKDCLKSVLQQTYPIGEILIIDDGSDDETVKIASQFPVKVIRHGVNKGLAAVRNTAIKHSTGKYLASLDADCAPKEDWLENLINNFSSKTVGIGGRLLESDLDSPVGSWRAVHMSQEWGKTSSNSVSFLFGSNNIFKKDILVKIGGYSENYKNNYEDVDISKRIKAAGYSLRYEAKALAYHLKNDTARSLFNTFWNWNFTYHEKKGYYNDYKNLYYKIKENIGLANKFIIDDLDQEKIPILYFDFLLCFYLSLKDFLYMYTKECGTFDDQSRVFYLSHLSLLDLTLTYHINSENEMPRTFIPNSDSFFQNFFIFLFSSGRLIQQRFNNRVFLNTVFKHLIEGFIGIENKLLDGLSKKTLLLFGAHQDWDYFLKKHHPNLNVEFLRLFLMNVESWFNDLTSQFPEIVNLIKVSQYDLVAKEGI
ncbi:glycosyltransferase [bacterium]|nr:glycosyltransferase [bacterium]